MQNKTKENSAITLIALVITIIVLLILAGVTIVALSGDNGILTNASKAKYATELSQYKEELERYKGEKMLENTSFEDESLISSENALDYNTKPEDEVGNIYNIIRNLKGSNFEGKLEVIKGELLLNSQDKIEVEVAQSVGIAVNPYEIIEGELVSSNGNLLLVDSTGTLRLPETVTSIGVGAFANVEGLKTIIIPGTVKTIKARAFAYNTTLETVIMEDGVEVIGEEAFRECRNLKKVQMPNTVKEIGKTVFYWASNLEDVNIPSQLKEIPFMAFIKTNIKNIEIPSGVVKIGDQAFAQCNNLESVKIPETVNSISSTAFINCPNLNNFEIDSNNNNFYYTNGFLLGKNKTEIVTLFDDAIKNNKIVIPDTVTTLYGRQFEQYSEINSIYIPASVVDLRSYSISNNITDVVIDENNPQYKVDGKSIYTKSGKTFVKYFGNADNVQIKDGVEILKEGAFYYGVNLTNITLPDSLKTIENLALAYCTNIKSLHFGKNLENITGLSLCYTNLDSITIDEDNPNLTIKDNVIYSKDGTIFITPIDRDIKSCDIPSGVKEIANYAFHVFSKLEEVTIPNTVEKIGASFQYCYELNSIEIPSSVKEMVSNCFLYSENLREIIVHNRHLEGSPWGCVIGDKAIIWK